MITDSSLHTRNSVYRENLDYIISQYNSDRGLEVENKEPIHSLDFKNNILALSLKNGEILIYEIQVEKENHKYEFLQKITKGEKSMLKRMNLTQRVLKLSEDGSFMFTTSVNDPLTVYEFKNKIFEKIFEVDKKIFRSLEH